MKIYLYLASLVALLCMAAQPAEAQRISVGKKGRVVVMRTDSTSAQEIVNQDGSRMNRARKTNHLQALAGNLRSDVDIDIPVSKAKQEKTFAVIIANENYEEEVNVEFALNDGVVFSQYCTKTLGIPQENVHVRQDATLNNILAEISWMQNIAKAYGDEARFIFYYAGHGVPDESNGTAYLLPVDGKSCILATGYSIGKLYDQLHALGSQNVTVVMDACFSGSKRGEGMLASARGVAIKSKAEAPKGNMLVISAAQGNETAYPYREKRHGLFTYFLLKKLQKTKGNTTFGELFDYVRTQVAQKSIVVNEKSQTPSVNASGELTSTWKQSKLF
jgi:hypothetical protein